MHRPLSPSDPLGVVLLLLSAVFFLLGGLFVLMPVPAALFYGLGTNAPSALVYVQAVGLRDVALASYLLGLTLAGQRRALTILLAATPIIPAGDMVLLATVGGATSAHYLLHLSSLLCFAGLALWARRSGRSRP